MNSGVLPSTTRSWSLLTTVHCLDERDRPKRIASGEDKGRPNTNQFRTAICMLTSLFTWAIATLQVAPFRNTSGKGSGIGHKGLVVHVEQDERSGFIKMERQKPWKPHLTESSHLGNEFKKAGTLIEEAAEPGSFKLSGTDSFAKGMEPSDTIVRSIDPAGNLLLWPLPWPFVSAVVGLLLRLLLPPSPW